MKNHNERGIHGHDVSSRLWPESKKPAQPNGCIQRHVHRVGCLQSCVKEIASARYKHKSKILTRIMDFYALVMSTCKRERKPV
jgi:hypothetical protein